MRRAGAGSAALLAVLLVAAPAAAAKKKARTPPKTPAASLTEAQRSLEDTRRRAEQVSPLIQQKARQAESVLAELDRLDRNLGSLREELKRYRDEIGMVEAQLEALRRQSRLTSQEMAKSSERLRRNLLTWQTGGGSDMMTGTDGGVVLADAALQCGVGEAERLTAGRMTKFDLQLRSTQKADRLTALRRLRRGLASKERELASALRARGAFLRSVQAEKERHERLLREYKSSGRALEQLVGRLADEEAAARRAAASVVPSTARVGQLMWPVRGPVVRRFGRQKHDAFNAAVFSTGIEIKAGEGTPVRAAGSGKVIFLDWLTGYGRVMIVDHGSGFYTLYGHLRDAQAGLGSRVNRGAVIGTVGDTGSIGAASLYFEVRHHGQPADPRRYLGGS